MQKSKLLAHNHEHYAMYNLASFEVTGIVHNTIEAGCSGHADVLHC